MMNLSVNIQTVALDRDEFLEFKMFVLSWFDVAINKDPTITDELIATGAIAKVRNMLVWHYQSKEDAKALHPEAF